jgi:hypothetical protein
MSSPCRHPQGYQLAFENAGCRENNGKLFLAIGIHSHQVEYRLSNRIPSSFRPTARADALLEELFMGAPRGLPRR